MRYRIWNLLHVTRQYDLKAVEHGLDLSNQPWVKPRIRVIIADDDTGIRRGLLRLLETHPEFQVVAVASNGQEAVELARTLSPDVIVMDIKMPLLDGIEAGRQVLAFRPGIKLLMMSSEEASLIRKALDIGARGYVAKVSLVNVPAAIQTVVSGGTYLCPMSEKAIKRDQQKPRG